MISILLDIAYVVLGLIASPYLLFRVVTSERWRAGLRERFGSVPVRSGRKPCVWIHAVSVGEANTAREFVRLLDCEHPDWDVRISTTTNTGQRVARDLYAAERCFYFPLDLSFAIARTFRRVRPDVVVLVELELWPNFLRVARRRQVPVVVINGRMREEQVGRYRAGRFLFRPGLNPVSRNLFCVQNETYRDRFERASVPRELIRVTGNMKYDALRTNLEPARVSELRSALGLTPEDRVWVAGCTWPGEEEICLRVHRRLQERIPSLRLVIAPRHIERCDDVERAIAASGYVCRRRSAAGRGDGPGVVALLDTVGELGYVYGIAEVVFVGKSLAVGGGHNMLEPAALGVPPVFGPLTDNFEAEASLLLDAGAAEQVNDETALGRALLSVLEDTALRRDRSRLGREALCKCRGASRRNLDILRAFVPDPVPR